MQPARLCASVVATSAAELEHLTHPAFACSVAHSKKLALGTQFGRLQAFFLSTFWSICLSRDRSATSCFNLRFSSSRILSLLTSAQPHASVFLPRQKVCSAMPVLRQILGTGVPGFALPQDKGDLLRRIAGTLHRITWATAPLIVWPMPATR